MPLPPLGYPIRVGIVKNVGRTFIDFEFLDRIEDQTFRTPIPHPYAGRGGGVLVGIEKDTLILVACGPGEKWYCISVVPDHNFYFDLDGASDIRTHETEYPTLKQGEICIKSNKGARIDLIDSGNICLDAGVGLSLGDIELSKESKALFYRIDNEYKFTEAGRSIYGVVKRDMNLAERSVDFNTLNFLDSESYDRLLSPIGRSSTDETQSRTSKLAKQTSRNPALVEKREVIYEYANSFNVRHFDNEVALCTDSIDEALKLNNKDFFRENRRTDILNLNQRNFNHLIEKVEGTLVDIYGNILDINRNIINIPDTTELDYRLGNDKPGLKRIYDHHRRAVKFHYEINSRKDIGESEPADNDRKRNNAKNFSRWSMDVDGEGLTKINIPASSETGNIPILSRYFVSRDQSNLDIVPKDERGGDRRDIRIQQFGAKNDNDDFAGTEIANPDYVPKTFDTSEPIPTAGTAYHDLINIADSIFSGGDITKQGKFSSFPATPDKSISNTVTNKIPNKDGTIVGPEPNAGGRSVHMNLDGSMEMSIGADTVDKKSLVIDTQGGVIKHYGMDRKGRSIVQQVDGDVIIQIGGSVTSGDNRFPEESPRPGRIEIHLNRVGPGTPTSQKIVIDENGLALDIQGNMFLKSSGDMSLDAGGRLLLNGESVFVYGATDRDTRDIDGDPERRIIRSGDPIS